MTPLAGCRANGCHCIVPSTRTSGCRWQLRRPSLSVRAGLAEEQEKAGSRQEETRE